MKKLKLFVLMFLAFATLSNKTAAQGADNKVNVTQLKIMVIPFTKDGEDIMTVLESDFNKRLVITKVKNGFDNRGFTTKDFLATLKEAKDDKMFTSGTQTDAKSMLIQFSGADVYVEVDVNMVNHGRGNSAAVLLTAYDAATGSAYANITCDSQDHYDTDNGTLLNVALTMPSPGASNSDESFNRAPAQVSCLDNFLNILQQKFAEVLDKGRPVKVNFTLAADASMNFDSKVKNGGGKLLKDLIDDWLASNSYKNNYNLQGGTSSGLFYDDVRIPVFDANKHNFKVTKFGQQITDYLQTLGVTASRSVKNGGLYITINN